MRIAFLAQTYPPMVSGAAFVARLLAEEMSLRGHEVLVITSSDTGPAYSQVSDRLTVLRLRSHKNPKRSRQRFLLYPRRQVMSALEKFSPQIIHTHEPFQLGTLGSEYARRNHIPIVATIHAMPSFAISYLPEIGSLRRFVERYLWLYAGWILSKFDTVIVPTATVSRVGREKIDFSPQIISNGVNRRVFHPGKLPDKKEKAWREKLNIPEDCQIILYVGRLDKDKNVDSVIRAAALSMQESNAHLLVAGDGHQKQDLIQLCEELGIADRSHFPGFISLDEGLNEIYRLGNVFVTACEVEAQGIVLLEAASSGLPIVAPRANAIPEIVHSEENGFLVEPGDLEGMAQAISTILNDPALARQLGLSSAEISAQHELSKTFDAYEQVYRSAIQTASVHERDDKSVLGTALADANA